MYPTPYYLITETPYNPTKQFRSNQQFLCLPNVSYEDQSSGTVLWDALSYSFSVHTTLHNPCHKVTSRSDSQNYPPLSFLFNRWRSMTLYRCRGLSHLFSRDFTIEGSQFLISTMSHPDISQSCLDWKMNTVFLFILPRFIHRYVYTEQLSATGIPEFLGVNRHYASRVNTDKRVNCYWMFNNNPP